MVARRGFLAGAAAVALSGCGRSETEDAPGGAPRDRTATSRQGDVELLQAALALERAHDSELARAHARRLEQELRDRDAAPAGGTHPAPADPQARQGDAIAFYLDMLPKLYDSDLRTLIASILVVEAAELARLRGEQDRDPAPDAFVYGFKAA